MTTPVMASVSPEGRGHRLVGRPGEMDHLARPVRLGLAVVDVDLVGHQ